ncbi:MAG TPA: hypothetical protein VL563_11460, partial [Gemmatimonadales bacterium]|nr:hypothetical protein [Gemmatimonadales bacterium]
LSLRGKGAVLRFSPWLWGLAVVGGAIVLLSFTLDYRLAAQSVEPTSFRWLLFGAGVGVAAAAFAIGVRQLSETHPDG